MRAMTVGQTGMTVTADLVPRTAMGLVLCLFATACQLPVIGCAGVGYYALQVNVQDPAGNPQAIGSAVNLFAGDYHETDSSTVSPLAVEAAEEGGGRTYDIQVTKQYYQDTWIRGVHTFGPACYEGHGNPTITVPAVLTLVTGAPQLRSIHVVPPQGELDRAIGLNTVVPTVYVDADNGISRAVRWSISGDTAAVWLEPATGILHYRCTPSSGHVILTALSVVDSTVFGSADIEVQGHPAGGSDPPCRPLF